MRLRGLADAQNGREAAGRREVAESGMTAFEVETVESCRSPASVPA